MHELSFSFQYGRSPHTSWGIPTSPYFNSYPCVKGNLATAVILLPPRLFQFTPLHEGRYAGRPCRPRFLPDFNSRPCAKGDGPSRSPGWRPPPYFNSRPCVRGDAGQPSASVSSEISIHAPTRGATAIRQHGLSPVLPHFNSRPYARGDIRLPLWQTLISIISIHAPTRGATPHQSIQFHLHGNISIHAPTRGATLPLFLNHGVHKLNFNSRPYARGDI